MGTWNTSINGNDTFLDIYQRFFDLYNEGGNPREISKELIEEFENELSDTDERNNILFGLALAQWETKSLHPALFAQVKGVIETGNDLEVWKALGADEKSLKKRKGVLENFLNKISSEKEKPKRRARPKFDFVSVELIKLMAPDGNKVFEAGESYVNGIYKSTSSAIMWKDGGGGIFHFYTQGSYISARWIDSQNLEIIHDKDIVFTQKEETFFLSGDQGKIVYIPK